MYTDFVHYFFLLIIFAFFSCTSQKESQINDSNINGTESEEVAKSESIDIENAKGFVYSDYDGFKGYDFVEGTNRIPFRIFVPENSSSKTYSLLLYIHGMGSVGSDNKKPLELSARFGESEFQKKHPCIVLVPQCSKYKRWVKSDNWSYPLTFSEMPTVPMALLMKLIEKIITEYPVDTSSIYVGGPSMGGFATWDLLCRLPDKFAAAFPLCGGVDLNMASKIRNVPIWCFHGARDPTVSVKFSRDMVKALKAVGGNPKYTEYPEAEHNVWDITLNYDPLFDWLFYQTRK